MFKQRRREGEREGEKHLCEREDQSVASCACPDQELNKRPLALLCGTTPNQLSHTGQDGICVLTSVPGNSEAC